MENPIFSILFWKAKMQYTREVLDFLKRPDFHLLCVFDKFSFFADWVLQSEKRWSILHPTKQITCFIFQIRSFRSDSRKFNRSSSLQISTNFDLWILEFNNLGI